MTRRLVQSFLQFLFVGGGGDCGPGEGPAQGMAAGGIARVAASTSRQRRVYATDGARKAWPFFGFRFPQRFGMGGGQCIFILKPTLFFFRVTLQYLFLTIVSFFVTLAA